MSLFISFICGAGAVFSGAILSIVLRKVIEEEMAPKPKTIAKSDTWVGPFDPRPPIKRN